MKNELEKIKTQIPIYRAKKMCSDEYVIGYLVTSKRTDDFFIREHDDSDGVKGYAIDISTLSINFPDMLDSQGNKIFAILSEDGKGGDILSTEDFDFVVIQSSRDYIHFVDGNRKAFTYAPKYFSCYNKRNYRIIGIQQ